MEIERCTLPNADENTNVSLASGDKLKSESSSNVEISESGLRLTSAYVVVHPQAFSQCRVSCCSRTSLQLDSKWLGHRTPHHI